MLVWELDSNEIGEARGESTGCSTSILRIESCCRTDFDDCEAVELLWILVS